MTNKDYEAPASKGLAGDELEDVGGGVGGGSQCAQGAGPSLKAGGGECAIGRTPAMGNCGAGEAPPGGLCRMGESGR